MLYTSKVIGILYIFITYLDFRCNHHSPRDRFIAKPITTTTIIHAKHDTLIIYRSITILLYYVRAPHSPLEFHYF